MIIFLHIMILSWTFGITLSILSGFYEIAILCSVFLLNTISDLLHEKEYEEVMELKEEQ